MIDFGFALLAKRYNKVFNERSSLWCRILALILIQLMQHETWDLILDLGKKNDLQASPATKDNLFCSICLHLETP